MRYRFGRFELVPETRELLADGELRALEPQVFDLLRLLIETRERLSTPDDLIAAIWQGRIVSDAAISARISAARAAIDDDGKQQRWIRTVPRRGFRFVGEVEAVGAAPAPAPAGPAAQREQHIAFCRSPDGVRIAYARSGRGYPLIKAGHWLTHLEHDWNSPIWRPLLDALSGSFELIRYDQRGNGLSDWDTDAFSLDRFVEDLEAVVDAANLGRFALYGTSQGAPIAIAYANRHPGRVTHLVLCGGFEQGRLVRSNESEREQAQAILTLMRHGWGQPGSAFIKAFATLFIPDGSREQIDSLVELQRQTTSAENAMALRAAVDRIDVSDQVERVAVPTLVMHSRGDNVQPLEQGRQLATRIKGAEFVLLESRNHVILPQEEAWRTLISRIGSFVLGSTVTPAPASQSGSGDCR